MVTCLRYTHIPNFGSLSWFRRCKENPCPLSPPLGLWRILEFPDWCFKSWFWRGKEHPCPLSPHLGLWRTMEVPDLGLASWSWFEYSHLYFEFWLSILILKVQRTSMSFKSWFGVLIGDGGFWLGFGILILIWIWSWVFDLALAFGLGSGFWLWHWFLHSRVEKICWPGWVWVQVGSAKVKD